MTIFFTRSGELAEKERQLRLPKDENSVSQEKREGPSSTPEFRQAVEEGLLVVDQGQHQGEGAGRAGVPLGVSGTLAMTPSPASWSTAPSPFPLSTNLDIMEESGDVSEMVQDVNWNGQVLEPILKTPSKNPASLAQKRKSLETTPSSPCLSQSSGSSAKKARQLLPSPGKRWLQTQNAGEVSEPPLETVEEMAEMIVCGTICSDQPKVCKRKSQEI